MGGHGESELGGDGGSDKVKLLALVRKLLGLAAEVRGESSAGISEGRAGPPGPPWLVAARPAVTPYL